MKRKAEHPFEKTIGPGPYRFIGVGKLGQNCNGQWLYHGPECKRGIGSCAHCGTGIRNIFVIRAGDGENYGVGCDCIFKSKLPYEVKTAAKKAKLEADRKRRAKLKAEKDEKLRRRYVELKEKLAPKLKALPHPNEYFAEQGQTALDYIEFISSGPTAVGFMERLCKAEGMQS